MFNYSLNYDRENNKNYTKYQFIIFTIMKVLVSFSGGKDSQACLIRACEDFKASNVTAVFCDTGWEHELTYRHVQEVASALGVELVVLKSPRFPLQNLCKEMKWFPDSMNRMCTVLLKIMPMIDYVLTIDDNVVIIQGIRAAESQSRSKLSCSANYFAEYLADDSAKKRLYRKIDVKEWCGHHTATVERPMFGESAQGVIDYILQHGQQPNPLYRRGFSRVGCFPCIFARLSDIKAMRHFPDYVQRVIELEKEVNDIRQREGKGGKFASFLPVGKIPARFCTSYGEGVPAFEDVIRYVSRDDAQLDMFDDDNAVSCMSVYHGLCE